jgi:hypothetical protein
MGVIEMRMSNDEWRKGQLINGFDYEEQAWVVNGIYQDCGHPRSPGEDCCNAHRLAGTRRNEIKVNA